MRPKFFLFLTVCFLFSFCIYYRPLYSTTLLILFFMENFYFANYAFKFYTYKKQDSYNCLQYNYDPNGLNSAFEIWLNIANILAYKKVYILCLKKKISFLSFLRTFLIILSGIPFKLLKIAFFLIKKNNSIRNNLLEYFYLNYNDIKNTKIEIINKRVYLNCSTRIDILKKITHFNRNKDSVEIFNIYRRLMNINATNMAAKKSLTQFNMGFLTSEEGVKIKGGHWSRESVIKINGDKVKTITHATSSVPSKISDTQFASIVMPDLQKKGSQNPGTIFTTGRYIYIPYNAMASKFVSSWQFEYTKYAIFKETSDLDLIQTFQKLDSDIAEILGTDPANINVREFSIGCHDHALLADSLNTNLWDTIKEEIDEITKI